MGIYRVAIAGNLELDFTVGTEHRTYGLVKEIKETTDVLRYDGDSYASSYGTIVKVIFEDQEIIFRCDNPYLISCYDIDK